jgi:hypothetical protein
MRSALGSMLGKFIDGRPEYVLFTSFTFSASFFEDNVLPLLCGTDINDLKGASLTRDMLNRQLAELKVVVACDHSAHPEPKGNLRYGLMTVALDRGRFHPKIVLMAGTGTSGRKELWLSVASANLSYSGWGVNREVVGITPVAAQHADELQLLITWLLRQAETKVGMAGAAPSQAPVEEGATRHVLEHLLAALSTDRLPANEARDLPKLHLALPPQIRTSQVSLLSSLLGGEAWREATVISPFWSDVPGLMTRAEANTRGDIAFRLVPAMQGDGYAFPSLPEERPASYARFADEPERYTHAKALLLAGEKHKVLCIGSANFTMAALQHGSGMLSNIEAMLRYRVDADYDWSRMLTDLARDDRAGADDGDEGAPPLPPFRADIVYDWRSKQFHCNLTVDPDAGFADLLLEIGPLTHRFDCRRQREHRVSLPLPLRHLVRSYKLIYESGTGTTVYVGLVTQLNAEDDQLGYLPKPRLDQVLALLHGLVPGRIDPRRRGGGGGGEDEESDPDGNDNAEPVFDFFGFFLATDKMRRYYADPRHRDENPLGTGSTSLYTLYRAVTAQADATPEALIGRYVQLAELAETLSYLHSLRPQAQPRPARSEIEEEMQRLELAIAPLMAASPHWNNMFAPRLPDAHTFLAWFRHELTLKALAP